MRKWILAGVSMFTVVATGCGEKQTYLETLQTYHSELELYDRVAADAPTTLDDVLPHAELLALLELNRKLAIMAAKLADLDLGQTTNGEALTPEQLEDLDVELIEQLKVQAQAEIIEQIRCVDLAKRNLNEARKGRK